MRFRPPLLLACSLATVSWPLNAQTLRGRVTDTTTGTAVAAAMLYLMSADNAVAATVVADDSGQYVLRAPRSGEYRLRLERIGYATRVSQPMQLSEGSLYNLPMQLAPAPVPMEPVTVKVEPRVPALENNGYYTRKKVGSGHFIDRPIIEKRLGSVISDLFQGVNGIRLVPKSGGRGSYVFLRGGLAVNIQDRGGLRPNLYCPARVLVDGLVVNPPGEPYDFELLNINNIEAIEVYRSPSQVPPHYGGAESACGVILVWRRVGS